MIKELIKLTDSKVYSGIWLSKKQQSEGDFLRESLQLDLSGQLLISQV